MTDAVSQILSQVQAATGIEIRTDRRPVLETKLWRRLRALKLGSFDDYAHYLRTHLERESQQVVSLVTTHVTSFFRDPDQFDFLLDHVLPELLSRGDPIRLWSAACSTGEEAYSLAMAALESLRQCPGDGSRRARIEVLGTDVDAISVARARNGVYPRKAIEHLNPEIVCRYFDIGEGDLEGMVRIRNEVHELCSFEVLNLLEPPYRIHETDVVFLRNVLIYFSEEETLRVLQELQPSLKPNGHLFVGSAEGLDEGSSSYRRLAHSVYQRTAPVVCGPIDSTAVRVLTFDDSRVVRAALRGALRREDGFVVVGEAEDALEAGRLVEALRPDVITLDIHMPRQSGIEYLMSLQGKSHPPVVMLSTVDREDVDGALKCLELGALEYLEKPERWDDPLFLELLRNTLRCAASRPRRIGSPSRMVLESSHLTAGQRDLILLGASTGGVEAVRNLVRALPEDSPPVVVVQHLLAPFTPGFAARLSAASGRPVHVSAHGLSAERGSVYVAAGGRQTGVSARQGRLVLDVADAPQVNRHRPSVDYLFESAARLGPTWRISAALLTGMGCDGARGLRSLRCAGAHTIAESEETAVVFGMPREAIALGAARQILPLNRVLHGLLEPFGTGG